MEGSPHADGPACQRRPLLLQPGSQALDAARTIHVRRRGRRPDDASAGRAHGSGGLNDLDLDGPVLEALLTHLEALPASLDLRLLNRVHLQEAVEVLLVAPAVLE